MAQLAALLGRFALFWAIWWLLTDGRPDGLLFGACCAVVAALVPLLITASKDGPPGRPGPRALVPTVLRGLLLLPFFLWQSLHGGIDVALRALTPRLPLAPTVFDYRLRLPPGPAPVMLASLVSLMPGTLATVSGLRLRVHVLDSTMHHQDELELLEALVAWVFGLDLLAPHAATPNLWRHGPEPRA